jgi:uncharacterized protein (DUF2147 family)
MKKRTLSIFVLILAFSFSYTHVHAQADKIVGLWKTIDDETGEAKSHVKIYKAKSGKYFGVIKTLLKEAQDKKCEECKGSLKDKPIVGMVILINMEEAGKELKGGKILDPGNGKFYHCTMEIDEKNPNKLKVRGSLDSWGVAGRTQSWYRVE